MTGKRIQESATSTGGILRMIRKLVPGIGAAALALAAAALSVSVPAALAQAPASAVPDVKSLVARTIAGQHRNDEALAEYERRERKQTFRHDESQPAEDKIYRVVPTGTGTLRLLVEESGRNVAPDFYRKQLRDLEQALLWALNPAESKQKQRVEKGKRRARERAELVDAVGEAFRFTWQGREARNGRQLARVAFQPNPDFKPRTRNSELFAHVRGTLWIDERESQLARAEAEIFRDISVVGGVFGKIYSGGKFVLEQEPVADGLWLPLRLEFHFRGRRFLFGFESHEVTTAGSYRRIGPPQQALNAVRHELNNAPPAPASK